MSPEGAINEATRFYDEPGRNQNAWANLPRYYWSAAADRPAPGATVLAWNPIPTAYGKVPLVAHHYAGRGRVMFVGTDETFRWRQNVGERFFYRFWGQSVRFVARRDARGGKKSWIEVRPLRATPGEPAEVELMAFGPDGKPLADPIQKIQITGGGKVQMLDVTADPLLVGRYTGRFTPGATGDYVLTYGAPGEVEARLRAINAGDEMRQPNLNRALLEQVAATSGGALVELTELPSIEKRLEGESKTFDLHREASLWDNWMTLALLAALYTIDVGIRRLMGLS